MLYRTHDSLITFNDGLGPLKTKSGGDWGGGVLTYFLKSDQIIMRFTSHG